MKYFAILLLFFTNCQLLRSQSYVGRVADSFVDDLKSFGTDYYRTGSIIYEEYDEVLLAVGVASAATYLFSLGDETLRNEVIKTTPDFDKVKFFNELGNVKTMGMVSGIVYGIGLFSEDSKIRETGRLLVESLVWSGSLNMLLRHSFGRYRPYNERGNGLFSFWQTHNDFQSFPSGHTTVAFSMATVLSFQIDRWWAYPLFYGLAGCTGATRIYLDQHWLSDVLFGAALGYAGGRLLLRANKNKDKEKTYSLSLSPGGLSFVYYLY